MATFPDLDHAGRRLNLYRLEPNAALPSEHTVRSRAHASRFDLPEDYIDFCCRFGASAFDRQALLRLPPHCPIGGDYWVDILYAVGAKAEWDSLDLWQSTYRDRVPASMLPIGTDPGGNLLLLGVQARAGVYAWDHEHRELAEGELEKRTAELRSKGVSTHTLDIDRILMLWDEQFPQQVKNPSGYSNLYRVADSFAGAISELREGHL